MIQRHSKVLSAVGTAKIYQPIPIVIMLKFKSVSEHMSTSVQTLALLSSLNPYHCPNYTFSLIVQKVLFFFIYWSLNLHSFFSVMPCGFYTYMHLIPVTFPEKFLLKSYVSFKSGVLLLWIPDVFPK